MTMRRDDALRALIPHVGERDIVVAVYQTNFDWLALNPRPLNYVAVGAMGQAASHGLGLALANPDRRVWVLDGDGSLLMNLGALVTVAGARPRNFYHILFANRTYEVNGDHPLPAADKVDFKGFARAAGYRMSAACSDLDAFQRVLDSAFHQPGPCFAALEIRPGAPYPRDYGFIHSAEARETFRKALNTPSE